MDSLGAFTGMCDTTLRGAVAALNAGRGDKMRVDHSGAKRAALILSVSDRLGARSIVAENSGIDGAASKAHEFRRSSAKNVFIRR